MNTPTLVQLTPVCASPASKTASAWMPSYAHTPLYVNQPPIVRDSRRMLAIRSADMNTSFHRAHGSRPGCTPTSAWATRISANSWLTALHGAAASSLTTPPAKLLRSTLWPQSEPLVPLVLCCLCSHILRCVQSGTASGDVHLMEGEIKITHLNSQIAPHVCYAVCLTNSCIACARLQSRSVAT